MEAADVGLVIDALSGVPLLALGLFVASVKPRRTVNLLFAGFAGLYGIRDVLENTMDLFGADRLAEQAPVAVLGIAGGVFLVAAATRFPRPLGRVEAGLALAAAAVAAVFALAIVVPWTIGTGAAPPIGVVQYSFRIAAYLFAALLVTLRFAASTRPEDERERIWMALVAAAFLPYALVQTAVTVGAQLVNDRAAWALLAVPTFVLVVLWTREAARRERPASRWARNVVLVAAASVLAGFVIRALAGSSFNSDFGHAGVSRLLGAGIFAYAILRHQLFDIDLKIKWGIRQSTVAGAFVAVVFVASEAASAFFAGQVGTYVGIAAAGLLVFALAPLQRVAERVADRAMPNVRERDAAYLLERKRATYRNALALAWQDGSLSESEHRHLVDLREVLALPAEEYARIESDRTKASSPPAASAPA